MIPANTFTAEPLTADFITPYQRPYQALVDAHLGGVAIGNPSQGRDVRVWVGRYEAGEIRIYSETDNVLGFALPVVGVTELSIAFDNNMNPVIAYRTNAGGHLYYYDTITAAYATLTVADISRARVRTDDVSDFYNASSDVLWVYVRGGVVYWRQQRDRYATERTVGTAGSKLLTQAGMTHARRFQIALEDPVTALVPEGAANRRQILLTTPTLLPDVPAPGGDVAPWARRYIEPLREIVQVREGRRGQSLDAFVTFRDLVNVDLLTISGAIGAGRGGITGSVSNSNGSSDLTPPPAATNLVVTPGFSVFFVEWDTPAYSAGGGHAHTEVWAAPYSGTGPLPTFADAVLLDRAQASLYAYPAGLSRTFHFWLKNVSKAGVAQTSPTGGTNGVSATTGKIGTHDLGPLIVTSQQLADSAVTAEKTLLDIGGENLLANNSFEVDANADAIADGWVIVNGSPGTEPGTPTRPAGRLTGVAQRVTWTGTNTTTKGVAASAAYNGGGVRGGWQPNSTYVVSWYARADGAESVGTQLAWNTAPSGSVAIKNPPLSATWQRYAYRITWGASVEADGALFIVLPGGTSGYVEFDDAQVELGDTLSGYSGKLAVNTIVAGDGAIANAAITNALIGNAAVDSIKIADAAIVEAKIANAAITNAKIADATIQSAKIVSLAAGKLTAGVIGGNLTSENFVEGSAGWIVRRDGTAEFQDVKVRGDVEASSLSGPIVNTQHIMGEAILETVTASGTSENVSTNITVPAGDTWRVVLLGTQDSDENFTFSDDFEPNDVGWLAVNGRSITLVPVLSGSNATPTQFFDLPAGVIANTLDLSAGTHTLTVSGPAGIYKTIVVLVAKR